MLAPLHRRKITRPYSGCGSLRRLRQHGQLRHRSLRCSLRLRLSLPSRFCGCRWQLWRRFHAALAWVVKEGQDGDLFDGVDGALVGECLQEFKTFYTSRWLSRSSVHTPASLTATIAKLFRVLWHNGLCRDRNGVEKPCPLDPIEQPCPKAGLLRTMHWLAVSSDRAPMGCSGVRSL